MNTKRNQEDSSKNREVSKAVELTRAMDELMQLLKVSEGDSLTREGAALSIQEVRLIEFLGQRENIIMRDLGQFIRLPLSTLTGVVDRLVTKGLVRRSRSEQDRRIVQVELTNEGQRIRKDNFQCRLEMSLKMLDALNTTEQDQLIGLMRKVTQKTRKGK